MDKNNKILTYAGTSLRDLDVPTLTYLVNRYCGPHDKLLYEKDVYYKIGISQQQFKKILNDIIFEKEFENEIGLP